MRFYVPLHVRHRDLQRKTTVLSMSRPYFVARLRIEDDFSILHQQCGDYEAILSHFCICIKRYKGEAPEKERN